MYQITEHMLLTMTLKTRFLLILMNRSNNFKPFHPTAAMDIDGAGDVSPVEEHAISILDNMFIAEQRVSPLLTLNHFDLLRDDVEAPKQQTESNGDKRVILVETTSTRHLRVPKLVQFKRAMEMHMPLLGRMHL